MEEFDNDVAEVDVEWICYNYNGPLRRLGDKILEI